ncbi:MAG: NAD-dependent epimerase/dehydratase family protein [Ferruginibacter sp.]
MKVALTGATGHVGAALLQELTKRNIRVKALIRGTDTRTCTGLSVEIIKGDILDTDALARLMQDCDAVIHGAAVISVNGDVAGLMQQTNVNGTQRVVDTALKAGIKRFIHISSIHAFKQQPEIDILDETAAPADEKSYPYGRSKYASQQIALSANNKGMEVLVISPTSIIGPYDYKPSLMGKAIIDLYKGRLPFIFDGGFNYCDGRDVAGAIVNALSMGKPGEVYLTGGEWHSLKELTQVLSKVSSKKVQPVALSLFAGKLGLPFVKLLAAVTRKEPLYTNEVLDALFKDNRNISSNKAKAALNYCSRPFEETIHDTFHWFKNNGYLD